MYLTVSWTAIIHEIILNRLSGTSVVNQVFICIISNFLNLEEKFNSFKVSGNQKMLNAL